MVQDDLSVGGLLDVDLGEVGTDLDGLPDRASGCSRARLFEKPLWAVTTTLPGTCNCCMTPKQSAAKTQSEASPAILP